MKTEILKLGDLDLNEFLSEKNNQENLAEELASIDKQIKSIKKGFFLGSGLLETEKNALRILKNKRGRIFSSKRVNGGYKSLNLSFLEMSSVLKYGENNIRMPRFCVYPVFDKPELVVFMRCRKHSKDIEFCGSISDLPKLLASHLLKAVEICKIAEEQKVPSYNSEVNSINFYNLEASEGFLKSLSSFQGDDTDRGISFRSELNVLIPKQTKDEIKVAREYFHNNLYFVAEVKPSEWNVEEHVQSDPLVIGVNGDECFLVTYFGTTAQEDYARKEFTS